MNAKPLAFLSHAHDDHAFAEQIARALTEKGVEVWLDKWEIKAGDSLVQKIFNEGLAKCNCFLILLSASSVKSKWVQEELDSAMVKKIQGATKVIPLLEESCEVPVALRHLLWVDLSVAFDDGIQKILNSVFEVSEKPPLGRPPEYLSRLANPVGNLSRPASALGLFFLSNQESTNFGSESSLSGEQIQSLTKLSPEQINDAVDELEGAGLTKVRRYIGSAPYTFSSIEPTYALYIYFKDEGLNYDPLTDIKVIISAVAAKGQVDRTELEKLVGLPPRRINRAVDYIQDYGIANVIRTLGTAPFNFQWVMATSKTRRYATENCGN
ncbi:MAG TPA: toll/interleukin-1 receptor domain-containing protein [Elusimicrobiota bacterium]|nr:toll/interleukin-1 receptor domain-containing protein [Elusimicrobiota bacterium]